MCLLFGAEVYNTEGGFVNDDVIVKPGQEASFYSGSKGLENTTESVTINGLVREEVTIGPEVHEIIDR